MRTYNTPRTMTLWIPKLRRATLPLGALFWLTLHALILAAQWYTFQTTPLMMQKSNAKGWHAVCIAVKDP